MEQSLGFAHFLRSADPVAMFILAVLLVMSVGSWYLIFTKGWRIVATRRRSDVFVRQFWDAPDIGAVAERLRATGAADPFSHLVHHGFTAVEQHRTGNARGLIDAGTADEFLTRALKRAIGQDRARLERGLSFLATVASSAPFVGLFGTVWGIYHALLAIGASGQGTLDKVAGPVGEALLMTGLGLAVAIPAAISYNAFVRANRSLLADLNAFAHDVFTFLSTGLKTSALLTDVKSTSERVVARAQAQAALRDGAKG